MTIKQAFDYAKQFLKNIPETEPVFEARQIIMYVTDMSQSEILSNYNNALTENQFDNLTDILLRRKNAEPLQYILGNWEFYSLPFKVGKGVLIPRADTEVLVDTAKEYINNRPLSVLDLCSGSGCIAIALKSTCKNIRVSALEKSDEALKYLNINAAQNNSDIKIIQADLFRFTPNEVYDLVVSNPPYIKSSDIKSLPKSVGFEPTQALDGGEDGLKFYRFIAQYYKNYIKDGGALITEVGFDQAKQVCDIYKQNGYKNIKTVNDYSGIPRVVFAQKES